MDRSRLLPARASGMLCLHTVRKRCYKCGHEWEGPAFAEYPKDRQPLPGICAPCNDAVEAHIKELSARARPIPEPPSQYDLKRPTREPEIDEDGRYGE